MNAPLTTALCARAVEGATGALDWTDGKRRRVFFFEHGHIVLAQSNLKSESAERLADEGNAEACKTAQDSSKPSERCDVPLRKN